MAIIKIRLNGQPQPVSYGEWVGLYTAEDTELEPLEFKLISLGVAMQLPQGYYAIVVPRSSTCKNHGIIMANSLGIIENSYCGDNDIWNFPAVAIRKTFIPKGTRICQFTIMPQHNHILFDVVEQLNNPDRGGLGSTGT